jgi:hypothetical protein
MPGIRHAFVVGVAALGAAIALAGCGSSAGSTLPMVSSPAVQFPARPDGELCIKPFQHGSVVQDVIGYLSASDSPLAGKTWRLVFSRFGCDPGSADRPHCAATATYPGPTRHGPPPVQTYCRTQDGTSVTTGTGCHDTLAQQMASVGDWSGFVVPKRFASGTWLCVAEQIRVGGSWHAPDRALATYPARACAEVSPA